MRTLPLLAAALAALAPSAAAQVVDGQLLERGTERPVEGAAVELLVGGSAVARAATDTAGRFTIALEDAGSYRLSVRRVGYAPATSQPFPVEKGDTTHVVVRLVAGTVLLAPVRAVADARRLPPTLVGFYDRVESNHSGRFITRDRIDQHAAMRTTDLLRTLAGVNVVQNRRGGTGMRRRGCEPAVYVDGVYVAPQGMSLDDLVRPHDLEGVEVYSASSLPPAFVRQRVTGCGAVLFWTRIEN